jgi:agmatine/peptidylarginine deiminase
MLPLSGKYLHMKSIAALLLLTLISLHLRAQDTTPSPQPLLRHEMTPWELLRKHEIGRGFVETDPPVAPVRNVAEFERMQGALVRYPFGIPISLIKEMATDVMVTTIVASASQKTTVLNQYVANGVDTSHCNFLIAPTDSYWTRDYGPWFESDSSGHIGIVDFPYNRPRPNDDEIPKKMAAMLGINWFGMNVTHTGGNYMCDGFGTGSSTNLVYVENTTQTPAQVDEKMNKYLGITDYQVVADPNISTTIDHIDCWSKFLAPDKILIRKTLPTDPEYNALESAAAYWASQQCSYGYNYKVYRVMTPADQPYSNSVIMNNKVLVPFMNSSWDDSAKAVYESAMPGYEVIGFIGQPSTPWMSTDALHCRVIGIADIGLLRISHIPITGNQPCEYPYPVNAAIIASSMQPVINDSVKIYYRVNGGTYQSLVMQPTTGNNYLGYIPAQPAGSTIEYYLTAADQSGRYETMPLVGPGGPFSFNTISTNLTAIPDTLWFRTPDDCLNGKITHLTNNLTTPLNLNFIQQNGLHTPWYVDSISATIPTVVNPGADVAVRVKFPLPLSASADSTFLADSLHFNTTAGTTHLMIMIYDHLLTALKDPESILVGEPWPNPFSEQVSVQLKSALSETVTCEIYNSNGIKVHEPDIRRNDNSTTITWNGKNNHQQQLPSGIYLLRINTPHNSTTKRLILTPP